MKKRVLFITPGLTKGGAETQLMKVASYMQTQGISVTILALKPINDFSIEGINVCFLKNWKKKPLENIISIFKLLKTYKPDAVVAFMFAAIILARLLKLRFNFRLVSSIRTPVLDKKWYTSFKATAALDDIVVYNSESSKLIFESNNLIKRKGIVINNAISLPISSSLIQAEAIKNGRPFVWCSVAHFRPEKDYPTLFKAAALLKNKSFRIDILGHINNQKWPYKMIKELGIEDKIRILGFQKNVGEYLRQADAFVLSTRWEGSPNSVLEAMAYNKPVIASAVSGIEDIISGSEGGFLFKQGDETELASAMAQVMEMTNSDRQILGNKGRRFIEMHYAEEAVMKKWLSILTEHELNVNICV